MFKVLTVFGTRPEVIKMAPLIQEIQRHPSVFSIRICTTAQHREMLDPLLKLFAIIPDYDLNLMQPNQTLEQLTASALKELGGIIRSENPNILLVQGDTTTAMTGSLAAFYQKTKIGHVEAGLRTGDKYHPFPEEVNRRIIDSLSDLFFAHSETAKQNLISEGNDESKIEVTGNTVIDALLETAAREFDPSSSIMEKIDNGRRVVLVTAHRRENFGKPIENICTAIRTLATRYASDLCFVYAVHLNPNVQKVVRSALNGLENVLLTEPLDYFQFVHLMKRAYFILTDSGGLQEEAPALGKPVLVLRDTTERPEAVASGCAEIVGTEPDAIVRKAGKLLEGGEQYERMSKAQSPYGDGKASQRIVRRLMMEAGHG